jgi:hypothetical protein
LVSVVAEQIGHAAPERSPSSVVTTGACLSQIDYFAVN